MTLEQLRIFVVVAEHQHMTRAAYALDMVQSAVSKTIARLEGEIALRLFDRLGRNIRLTQVGASFRDRAVGLLEHADRLSAYASELRPPPRRTIDVTATSKRWSATDAFPASYRTNLGSRIIE